MGHRTASHKGIIALTYLLKTYYLQPNKTNNFSHSKCLIEVMKKKEDVLNMMKNENLYFSSFFTLCPYIKGCIYVYKMAHVVLVVVLLNSSVSFK